MAEITPWLTFTTAAVAESPGGMGWANPQAALDPDGQEAASANVGVFPDFESTDALRLGGLALGDHLPARFALIGLEIETRGRWTGTSTSARSLTLRRLDGAQVAGNIGACALPLGPASGVCVAGGPAQPLGLRARDLTAPGFGVQLLGSATGAVSFEGNTLLIDSVRARVFWEGAPGARSRSRRRAAFTGGLLA